MSRADVGPTPDVPLEYAPGAPIRRRRRRRWAVGVLMVLVAVAVGFWFGPAWWKRGWTAFVTRQACTYAERPDLVVYEDGPATSRPLIAAGIPQPASAPTLPAARSAPDPPILARLTAVAADPRVFTMFAARGPSQPLAFLHERRTPQGQRFLVVLRLTGLTYYPSDGGTLACTYTALLLHPNGFYPPTHVSLTRAWGGVHIPGPGEIAADRVSVLTPDPAAPPSPGPIRVYFGAADPADESAFTIPYEVNGRRKHWRFRVSEKGMELDEQVPTTTR